MQLNLNLKQQNFNGKLIIGDNITDDIVNVLSKSKLIRNLLKQEDDLFVNAKWRFATRDEICIYGKDDVLYKVFFSVRKPVKNIFDRIANFFATKKYLSSNYHSSQTNSVLAKNEERISKVLSKWIKNN